MKGDPKRFRKLPFGYSDMEGIQEQDYQQQKIDLKIWKRIYAFAIRRKSYIVWALFFGMLTGVLDLCTSLVSMWAIDGFIAKASLEGFWQYIAVAFVVQMLFAVFTLGFAMACGRLEAHLIADIREEAFTRLQTLSFSFFDKTSVGYLLTRMTTDVDRTIGIISWSLIDIGWGIMAIIASIVGMFIVNWRLALILIIAIPALVLISVFFQKRILSYQRETRRLGSMITSAFNEGVMGARTTKTLVREELNNKEFTEVTRNYRTASMRAALISALYLPTASLIISVVTSLVLLRGGHSVMLGALTIGQLNFFINIGNMMFEPIRQFAGIFAEFQSSQAAAERVVGLLTAEQDIVDSAEVIEKYGDVFNAKTENWEPVRGDVTFENVSFWYKEGEPVLKNFNLEVKAGENIALVGETGGGKSTIVNLVCRFYEPQTGRILIDGKDVKERSQLWLESSLGYVLQSPHLFSGSIADNIRYGKPSATDEEIRSAAEMVGAHEFITALDKGYDTEVGEGGGLLSTGQKQLISFARAIIADPRIFILDEATSSIDTESEIKIQKASELLLKDRTSFIIAHRLSTVRSAEKILVIIDGEIAESGTHAELIAKRGRYYELYTNQFKDDKLEESIKQL